VLDKAYNTDQIDPLSMGLATPVIAGLGAGIVLILVLGFLFLDHRHTEPSDIVNRNPLVAEVIIPFNSSMYSSGISGFEPSQITVVIGVNNTVRWVNHDNLGALLKADDASDPTFYNATKDFVFILPNKTFDYTFTQAGKFAYHGKPFQQGIVIVLPSQSVNPKVLGSIAKVNSTILEPTYGLNLTISGMKDTYRVGEPIAFNITASGFGYYCQSPNSWIQNASLFQNSFPIWRSGLPIPLCISPPPSSEYRSVNDVYPYDKDNNITISEPGNYTLGSRIAGDPPVKKEFRIIP